MTPLVKDIIMSSTRMPALFLGHGSPMNVLEDNLYTRSWQKLGMTLPRPQAIVVVSAQYVWFSCSLSHLFCVEVRISPLIRWPNLLCHYIQCIQCIQHECRFHGQ